MAKIAVRQSLNLNDKQLREVFHFLFLERLLKVSDSSLYVLKGGVNLRFFFKSPRYSEDMDIDVLGGGVATLKKNGYKILEDESFKRVLKSFGIEEIKVNDPAKAKQTETTQRFKLRLVNSLGEEYPTKVEFSRRDKKYEFVSEMIDPEIVRPYQRLAFQCQHYGARSAIQQKIQALAHRAEQQARDPFDLYMLWSGGHVDHDAVKGVASSDLKRAAENLMSLSYSDYQGQVVEYLSNEDLGRYKNKDQWNQICDVVIKILEQR